MHVSYKMVYLKSCHQWLKFIHYKTNVTENKSSKLFICKLFAMAMKLPEDHLLFKVSNSDSY